MPLCCTKDSMRGNNQDRPKDKTRGNKVIFHDIHKSEKPIGQQSEEMLTDLSNLIVV